MTDIQIKPISDDLSFGVAIRGISLENSRDFDVRAEVNRLFDSSGMIVFEGVDPTNKMQAAISEIFGNKQGHDIDSQISDDETPPGFIDIFSDGVVEVNGEHLENFLPWHFDQCYSKALTRGGVLRALSAPPEGGLTGFVDGIQIFKALPAEFRTLTQSLSIIYDSGLLFWNMKFGRPKSYRPISISRSLANQMASPTGARSIHPAVWTRATGEKVFHVSPMQAAGIEGMETVEGHALLETICQEMYRAMNPYFHKWKDTDMVIWDNHRFMHCVSGNSSKYVRNMRRTIILDDYGLGRRE